FTGIAVAALPPLTIVALRVGLAALILNLALRPMGLSLPADRRVWAAFVGMGILNNVVPFSLIVFGQTRIGSGLAAILNATTPLFAVVVAHLATPDERLTPARLAGVALGLLGVVAMVGPAALHGLGGALAAQVACLAAALSYAVAGLYGRRFQALGVAPPATAAGMLTASAVLIAPLALLVDRPWTLPWPGPAAVAALLGLAALSTALAYLLYFRLLASAGATNLLLVTFLIPVSAVALGVLVLGEAIAARQVLGMALIGAGLAAIDGRALRLLVPSPTPDTGAPEP
ncbi:MAG TPA: DMT family transporter, partial [Beijerinckiaceae bacterium]|nr:DMT family transporter [Beijerinckiaceae bacterium]